MQKKHLFVKMVPAGEMLITTKVSSTVNKIIYIKMINFFILSY